MLLKLSVRPAVQDCRSTTAISITETAVQPQHTAKNRTAEISSSGIARAAWSRDHGCSRRIIFGGSAL